MKTNCWFNRNRLLPHLRIATAGRFILILLVLVSSASSLPAATAQTYHGTLTGGTFLCNGDPSIFAPIVTGTWNVIIDPKTPAQVSLNVFYDGGHHLAFGYNALMLVWFANGVYVFSGFGDAVTVTLDTNKTPATFSWHVQPSGGWPGRAPLQLSVLLRSGDPRRWITFVRESNRQFKTKTRQTTKTARS